MILEVQRKDAKCSETGRLAAISVFAVGGAVLSGIDARWAVGLDTSGLHGFD